MRQRPYSFWAICKVVSSQLLFMLPNEPLAKLQFGFKFALASPDSIFRKVPMPSPDMSLCETIEPALQSSNLHREASFARGSNNNQIQSNEACDKTSRPDEIK